MVSTLQSMGFDANSARDALRQVSSLEQAIEWLFIRGSRAQDSPSSVDVPAIVEVVDTPDLNDEHKSVELVRNRPAVGNVEVKGEVKLIENEEPVEEKENVTHGHKSEGKRLMNKKSNFPTSSKISGSPSASIASSMNAASRDQDSKPVTIHSSSSSSSFHEGGDRDLEIERIMMAVASKQKMNSERNSQPNMVMKCIFH